MTFIAVLLIASSIILDQMAQDLLFWSFSFLLMRYPITSFYVSFLLKSQALKDQFRPLDLRGGPKFHHFREWIILMWMIYFLQMFIWICQLLVFQIFLGSTHKECHHQHHNYGFIDFKQDIMASGGSFPSSLCSYGSVRCRLWYEPLHKYLLF